MVSKSLRSITRILVQLTVAAALVNLAILLVYAYMLKWDRTKINPTSPQSIIALSPHHDDAAIVAGGAIIKNSKLGGISHIFYFKSSGASHENDQRFLEAKKAWADIDSIRVKLVQLNQTAGEASRQGIKSDQLAVVLANNPASQLYIPLLEHGHSEHDLVNKIGWNLKSQMPGLSIIQCAEYNPYLVAANTPWKIIGFFLRLLPYLPYVEPTSGLIPTNQTHLAMTPHELKLKRTLIAAFTSQQSVIGSNQFGHEDLYESGRKPPMNNFRLFNKYFSPWTVFSLLIWAVALGIITFRSALLCAALLGTKFTGTMLGIALLWISYKSWQSGLWYIKEDGAFSIWLLLFAGAGLLRYLTIKNAVCRLA